MGSKKEFNNIFNECLEHLLTGQETVEQCLRRYPEYAAELEPLLRTTVLMNKAVDVKPSAEFRAKARYQMQLKMAQAKSPNRNYRAVPRWAIAVCSIMLVFVLGGGTVLASRNSMPGNPLYAVKLAAENIQVTLTGYEEKKTELYIAMADERLTEMTWMVDNGKTQNLEAAASRLNSYYNAINALPLAANTSMSWAATYQSDAAPAVTTAATTEAPTTLAAILPVPSTTGTAMPPDKNSSNTTVIAPSIVLPATTMLITAAPNNSNSSGGNAAAPQVLNNAGLNTHDTARLMNILIYNANTQPEQIQKLLDSDKVPESAKPTLRRALAAAIAVYQATISNLNH